MKVDIVIGQKLTNNITQEIYLDRKDINVLDAQTSVDLIKEALKAATSEMSDMPGVIKEAIGILDTTENKEIALRDVTSFLSYSGYDVYLLGRKDDVPELSAAPARAYLLDTHDDLLPAVAHIASAECLVFEDRANISLSDAVMTFMRDTVRLSDVAESALNLRAELEKYTALYAVHSSYSYDCEEILSYLEDYGYKVLLVVNA